MEAQKCVNRLLGFWGAYQRFGQPIEFTAKFGRKAFTTYQWMEGTQFELIHKLVGHSPNSRVTEANYLHMPAESRRDAVLNLDALAGEAKRKRQYMARTKKPPEGGLL